MQAAKPERSRVTSQRLKATIHHIVKSGKKKWRRVEQTNLVEMIPFKYAFMLNMSWACREGREAVLQIINDVSFVYNILRSDAFSVSAFSVHHAKEFLRPGLAASSAVCPKYDAVKRINHSGKVKKKEAHNQHSGHAPTFTFAVRQHHRRCGWFRVKSSILFHWLGGHHHEFAKRTIIRSVY